MSPIVGATHMISNEKGFGMRVEPWFLARFTALGKTM
jgi:hypothetical protein